jgi:hypothetical protein
MELNSRPTTVLFLILILGIAPKLTVKGWEEHNYRLSLTDELETDSPYYWNDTVHREWFRLWRQHPREGPRGRSGHSLLTTKNNSSLILFGGRDNDQHVSHVPSTFELVEINGKLEFVNYDEKELYKGHHSDRDSIGSDAIAASDLCQRTATCISWRDGSVIDVPLLSYCGENETRSNGTDDELVCNTQWTHPYENSLTAEQQLQWEKTCGFAPVATLYNDIWIYDTHTTNLESSDNNAGSWRVLYPGAAFGNCQDDDPLEQDGHGLNGTTNSTTTAKRGRTCDAPAERWKHGAAMVDDRTLMIYGGYSQECGEEYCDDVWLFAMESKKWTSITSSGNHQVSESDGGDDRGGPGPRWRHSMLGGIPRNVTSNDGSFESVETVIIMFGGHRQWRDGDNEVMIRADQARHSHQNTTLEHPKGGYLNDLWIYHPPSALAATAANEQAGTWTQSKGNPTYDIPLNPHPWEPNRDTPKWLIRWPKPRAGHAAAYDPIRHGMWIFGGYTAFYPYGPYYPSSSSSSDNNSNAATMPSSFAQQNNMWSSVSSANKQEKRRLAPYPSHPYYLDDLWFYDLHTGLWEEKRPGMLCVSRFVGCCCVSDWCLPCVPTYSFISSSPPTINIH